MKQIKKLFNKAFTLVELVVVVAIIAILSGISVAAYVGITTRSKTEADKANVSEWNTLLKIETVEGSIDNIIEVQDYFKDQGFGEEDFIPRTTNYGYYYCLDNNTVYLVDDSDSNFKVTFPEDTLNEVTEMNSYRLNYQYCLLNSPFEGITLSRNALVVGVDNELEFTTDSSRLIIGSTDCSSSIQDGKITINPTDSNTLDVVTEYTPLCFVANATSVVSINIPSSAYYKGLSFSFDGINWNEYTKGQIRLSNVGDKLYFRNTITSAPTSSNYLRFVGRGNVSVCGNLNSMYIATGFKDLNELGYSDSFNYMFYNNASITDASSLFLPANKLSTSCYFSTFNNCTSLKKAPALSAENLQSHCYFCMFKGCTALTQAPALPATTLALSCYQSMFQRCTSLTQAPALPATTLAGYCYATMFQGCTSLTQAPALLATTLTGGCYHNMFYGCTSLKITESSGTTSFFTCPSTIPYQSVTGMFTGTGGTFTGTPTAGKLYYFN